VDVLLSNAASDFPVLSLDSFLLFNEMSGNVQALPLGCSV